MCPEVTLFTQWPPQSDELSQRLRWGGHTWSGSRLEMVSQEFVETTFKTSCSLNPFFLLSLFLFFLPSLRTNKAFFKHHLYAKVVMLIIVVLAEGKSNQMTKSPCSPRPYHLWGETNALFDKFFNICESRPIDLLLQCREHGFHPWCGRIPYTLEQPSPCATAAEALTPRACTPHREKPPR